MASRPRERMPICPGGLTGDVERMLALDRVRGVRLGLRAKTANDGAQVIVAELREA